MKKEKDFTAWINSYSCIYLFISPQFSFGMFRSSCPGSCCFTLCKADGIPYFTVAKSDIEQKH